MKFSKQLFTVWILGFLLLSGSAFAESNQAKEVLIDLSSPQMSKVRRAFHIGTKLREMQKVPVTINMSLGSVQYASKNFKKAEMIKVMDQSISDLINGFLEAGGVVYVCPMCMHGLGIEEKDLIDNMKLGGPSVFFPLVLKDGVKLLSY